MLCVKYQVTNERGEVLDEHSTYSDPFDSIESASEWINAEEGEAFLNACTIDSQNIGGRYLADELLIVRVNGFPVTEEEVIQ